MSNVVDIEKNQPHAVLTDPMTGNAHVVPMSVVRRWADGGVFPDPECVRALAYAFLSDAEDSHG
jgi:hypothetical protein